MYPDTELDKLTVKGKVSKYFLNMDTFFAQL